MLIRTASRLLVSSKVVSQRLFSQHAPRNYNHLSIASQMKQLQAIAPIKRVDFDAAGTVVDDKCLAPFSAFELAFIDQGIALTASQITNPMGKDKKAHIQQILAEVKNVWVQRFKHEPGPADVEAIYQVFLSYLNKTILQHTALTPHTASTLMFMHLNQIPFALTSGYPRVAAELALSELRKQFEIQISTTGDEVADGTRIAMVKANNAKMGLKQDDMKHVILVSDAHSDIESVINHSNGPWAIAVLESSTHYGIASKSQLNLMSAAELLTCKEKARKHLQTAQPHILVANMSHLPLALLAIQKCIAAGLTPATTKRINLDLNLSPVDFLAKKDPELVSVAKHPRQ